VTKFLREQYTFVVVCDRSNYNLQKCVNIADFVFSLVSMGGLLLLAIVPAFIMEATGKKVGRFYPEVDLN
jgi:hypothetical protein